jgi:hypothetical protein
MEWLGLQSFDDARGPRTVYERRQNIGVREDESLRRARCALSDAGH